MNSHTGSHTTETDTRRNDHTTHRRYAHNSLPAHASPRTRHTSDGTSHSRRHITLGTCLFRVTDQSRVDTRVDIRVDIRVDTSPGDAAWRRGGAGGAREVGADAADADEAAAAARRAHAKQDERATSEAAAAECSRARGGAQVDKQGWGRGGCGGGRRGRARGPRGRGGRRQRRSRRAGAPQAYGHGEVYLRKRESSTSVSKTNRWRGFDSLRRTTRMEETGPLALAALGGRRLLLRREVGPPLSSCAPWTHCQG